MGPKIYTKGGDRGETGILGQQRVSKADVRLYAYGEIDELNAAIGFAVAMLQSELAHLSDFLRTIQNQLFVIGSHLACADDNMRKRLPNLNENATKQIEDEIDAMTAKLPELREFILPGGAAPAATLHLCRTVCRRAEREVVRFFATAPTDSSGEYEIILSYLNRLSDYLFVAARFANHALKVSETTWRK